MTGTWQAVKKTTAEETWFLARLLWLRLGLPYERSTDIVMTTDVSVSVLRLQRVKLDPVSFVTRRLHIKKR